MGKILSKKTIQNFAKEAIQRPSFLNELSEYELSHLHDFVKEDVSNINWAVKRVIKINPDFEYPPNTSKFKYWIDSWDKENNYSETSYRDRIKLWNALQKRLSKNTAEIESTSIEDNTPDEELNRLKKLAERYCKRPNTAYDQQEVLFILKKANSLKHLRNVSALIRTIQDDTSCPDSIKDLAEFCASNTHAKRQRKVIEFYDKETGNKRNEN